MPPVLVIRVGLLLLVFVLGFISRAQGWDRYVRELGEALVAHPKFTLTMLLGQDQIPSLHVNMNFADYQYLLTQRAQALRVGAHLIEGQDPAPATFIYEAQSIDVAFHLLEGPVVGTERGLDSGQWSFQVARVSAVGDQQHELLDWRWATLVPAKAAVATKAAGATGAEALLTWGYLAAAREAGLPATRFNLVRLFINGKAWGLYALETLPAVAPDVSNNGSLHPIVYFDQEAYLEAWANLVASDSGHKSSDEIGAALLGDAFAYAQPVATDAVGPSRAERVSNGRFISAFEDDLPLDVAQAMWEHRLEALELLYQLQRGELAPSEVFDVDALAHFLALTMLWYGSPDLDWRTFYLDYDPAVRRFVPIANGGRLALPATSYLPTPLPRAFIDDPVIQHAFLEALIELQAPAYLPRQQARLGERLEALRLSSGADLGYPSSPWMMLAQHQARIRRIINPPRTLFVDLVSFSEAVQPEAIALVLRLANLQPYPVEVLALDLGENAIVPLKPAWVDEAGQAYLVDVSAAGARRVTDTVALDESDPLVLRALSGEMPNYVYVNVPLAALPRERQAVAGEIYVVTRLWGLASTSGLDDAARVVVPVREDYLQALCERSDVCGEAVDDGR